MKRISFSMTERQFLDGTKTVTRRLGWKTLKAGEHLMAVRRAMGLKKGEKQVKLGEIVVLSVRREPLYCITAADVIAEGYPDSSSWEFIDAFVDAMGIEPSTHVTRIEFERVA